MKIIILCKRRPMGRDLMLRPYGRFYNLAYHLSRLGHDVELFLFSYKRDENETIIKNGVKMKSISIFPNPLSALSNLYSYIKQANADWLMGFSDIYFGILAENLSRLNKKKSLIDAYDNFESYIPFAKPLHWLWRRSIRRTDIVTCAGPSLEQLFRQYRKTGTLEILPMTIDHDEFFVQSRQECRKKLGLPLEKKIVGYHGSIHASRDINTFFLAASLNQTAKPDDMQFVVAGKKSNAINIPDNINYLGYLSDDDMPLFINSLDVLIVTNKDSAFGNYSYPVKLYEAISCNTPVIVSKTKSTSWIMRDYPQLLVDAGDVDALAKKIKEVSVLDRIEYNKLPGWFEIADHLSGLLKKSINN